MRRGRMKSDDLHGSHSEGEMGFTQHCKKKDKRL